MNGQPIRVLRLEGSPAERGRAHGLAYGEAIRAYTAERMAIAADASTFWAGAAAGVWAKASGKSAASKRADRAGRMFFMGEVEGEGRQDAASSLG